MFLSHLVNIQPLPDQVSTEEFTKYITPNIEQILDPLKDLIQIKEVLIKFIQVVLSESEKEVFLNEVEETFG